MIAFFELFELVVDIVILTVKYCSAKSASKQINKNNSNSKAGLDDGAFIGEEMLPEKLPREAFSPKPTRNRTGIDKHSRVTPSHVALTDV